MMKLKNYNEFLNEKIMATNTDTPAVLNDINQVNDLEKHLQEFNSKKVDLENIYKTSTDENNLLSVLKGRGFISPTTNKKEMKFQNPILGKYAQVCDFKKQVDDLTKQMTSIDSKIKEKELQIKDNPTQKSTIDIEIKTITTDKDNIKNRLNSIKDESDRQEREVMEYFREMESQLNVGKKNIKQSRDTIFKSSPK